MARIHELLAQLRASAPALAADIEREVDVLADRRAFGLNFERHTPEAVELPGRKVRAGDKVRVQPPRGDMPTVANRALYRVATIERDGDRRVAMIAALGAAFEGGEAGAGSRTVNVDDLVVVAEFRDPIYPGIISTGKVERGGDKPYHSVVNAENFHALQTLLFTHRGRIDAVYIDPPYNSGAKDWKYNNDYVEGDDLYRHSKWLAMLERRLLLAKELLNPADSVLIVTIDEKEYLRLGMLLTQIFPEAAQQMVTTLTNPKGVARGQEFYRVDEYIYFVRIGASGVRKTDDSMILTGGQAEGKAIAAEERQVRWGNLLRSGTDARRADRPNQFFPVFLRIPDGSLHSVGDPLLPVLADRNQTTPPDGTVAVWPIRQDGSEGRWQVGATRLRELFATGLASIGRFNGTDRVSFSYVTENVLAQIESGVIVLTGRDENGAVRLAFADDADATRNPKTMWNKQSHSASEYGTTLLRALLPQRTFPYPKSLYAVEDSLRFFVKDKPGATVLDFFSGSGTAAHAVMRLNRQDGGRRTSISVTNNEVSADEQKALRQEGLRPGDTEWERWGICDYITKPRIRSAITGETPDGQPIKGDYKFTDPFPMKDGLEENVEFFTLTYESPMRVQSNREFGRIAPFLWLRAGSRGRRIQSLEDGWDVTDAYGVLADLDQTAAFLEAVAARPRANVAFIVTDEDRLFQAVVRDLPPNVEPVRMYESYLRNFEIDAMRSVR